MTVIETIEEFAGYVKIISPYANIDGLYPPDMACRLAAVLSELEMEDLDEDTREWVESTIRRLAHCSERAEAVRNELRERGYSIPVRSVDAECVLAELR